MSLPPPDTALMTRIRQDDRASEQIEKHEKSAGGLEKGRSGNPGCRPKQKPFREVL
jgi:hypothetical protein